ncbi:uncharacterized protein LOC114843269 isoform X3 [Betta splendens]|uniref:Uncharacterized protein LOC114843269 isoform X3 n=1 Tax=Betta splendens TaxID=158456 RepID=A0A9W2XCY7_BETSP|nr:uncharacterized protein LOC114843269 isoform X3 [Betta splendens]
MTPNTIKESLAKMLHNLSKEDFERFCDHLLDRRQEPRVPMSRVEGKRRWEIAYLLVSTFTEAKSAKVAVEILEKMGCRDEAEKLDSQTKHFQDNGDPTFRRTADGSLDLQRTVEALTFKAPTALCVKKPEEVEAEAKNQESLTQYAFAYPDFLKEVKLHAQKEALKSHAHRPTTRFGPNGAKRQTKGTKTRRQARSQQAPSTRGRSIRVPKPAKGT